MKLGPDRTNPITRGVARAVAKAAKVVDAKASASTADAANDVN